MKMKLLLFFTMLIIALLPFGIALASDITDAKYNTKITITNSGDAITNQVAVFTLSTAEMINKDMLNATATDYALKKSGTIDTSSQAGYSTNPWCVFIDSIDSGTTIFNYLYSKDVAGGDFAYFPGTTGMVITDNASLELGNSFNLEKKVCLALSGDFVVRKNVSYYEFYDSATYFVEAYSTHIVSTAKTEEGANNINHPVTMPGSITAGNILLLIISVPSSGGWGNPAGWNLLGSDANGVYVAYYKVATGIDTVTITTTNAIRMAAIVYNFIGAGTPEIGATTSGTSTSPAPPAYTTSVSTAFAHIWIPIEGNDGGATVSAYPAGYGSGISAVTTYSTLATAHLETYAMNGGSGPFTISASKYWGANTIMVPITNISVTAQLSAPVSLGEHLISVTSSVAGGSVLEVDGVTVDTGVALSVANNSLNWQIGSMATIYIDYYKHYIGGVLKCHIEWAYGATFPDLSGNGNTATPTFRTTSSDGDLTATVTSTQGTYEQSVPVAGSVGGWELITTTPPSPSGLFTDGGTGFPLGPEISTAATEAGDNPDNWIILFAIGLSLIIFILLYAATHKMKIGQRGSLILAFLGSEAALAYFYIVGAIPGLALIPIAIIILGLVLLRKSTAPVD